MIANTEPWLAAVIATILGFAVSYVFFGKLRDAVALDFAARREGPSHDPDRDAEDAAADFDSVTEPAADDDARESALESDRQSEADAEQQSGEPRQL